MPGGPFRAPQQQAASARRKSAPSFSKIADSNGQEAMPERIK
jgi:hypothetical protein